MPEGLHIEGYDHQAPDLGGIFMCGAGDFYVEVLQKASKLMCNQMDQHKKDSLITHR